MDENRSTVCLLSLHVCLQFYELCGDGDQCLAAVSARGVSVCGSRALLGEGFAWNNGIHTTVLLSAWHSRKKAVMSDFERISNSLCCFDTMSSVVPLPCFKFPLVLQVYSKENANVCKNDAENKFVKACGGKRSSGSCIRIFSNIKVVFRQM